MERYKIYCDRLEGIVLIKKKNKEDQDNIELLTSLIEKWNEEHNTFPEADPIELLNYLMKENKLKTVNLAATLGIGKSLLSDILNYWRGLSGEVIRKLADHFKVAQELFNKSYK